MSKCVNDKVFLQTLNFTFSIFFSFYHPFVASPFIHLFIYSFIHLFIYSFVHLFICSFTHLRIYSFTQFSQKLHFKHLLRLQQRGQTDRLVFSSFFRQLKPTSSYLAYIIQKIKKLNKPLQLNFI